MRHDRDDEPGNIIGGKWRLDEPLGEGGLCSVWAATHRNGYRAALKILRARYARDDEIRQRFQREGHLANRVPHPGVVPVLDDLEHGDGRPVLVLELLEGVTAAERLRAEGAALPPGIVVEIARGVLDILASAHGAGVIHRDIKPANVFLENPSRIRVLDFGVARDLGPIRSMTRGGMSLGTLHYMPPEQALGRNHLVTPRSDVFAVGATMVKLLTGKRIRHGRSEQDTFVAACTEPARTLSDLGPHLPVELRRVVDRALAFDPAERWPSAQRMAAALDAIPRSALGRPARALPGRVATTSAPASAPPPRLDVIEADSTAGLEAPPATVRHRINASRRGRALLLLAVLFATTATLFNTSMAGEAPTSRHHHVSAIDPSATRFSRAHAPTRSHRAPREPSRAARARASDPHRVSVPPAPPPPPTAPSTTSVPSKHVGGVGQPSENVVDPMDGGVVTLAAYRRRYCPDVYDPRCS